MSDAAVHGQLLELAIGDDPAPWTAAGFDVHADTIRLGDVILRLVGSDGERGIVGWSLDGVEKSIDGLTPINGDRPDVPSSSHLNGVGSIDHVVVETDDFQRTVPAFASAGIELRRTRTFDLGDGERQQCFFWLGTVILELVGMVEPTPESSGPARFWGLALACPDLAATAAHLGALTSPPKPAVQKGRFISTLRTRELDISLPIALMSPHGVSSTAAP